MEILIVGVLALLAIIGASMLSSRSGVAAPLLLVVAGIVVSFLPFVPSIEVEPELILAGILPPLLYSASVSMPTMDFRREFTAIGGLSVVLVVVSTGALGLLFWWLVPELGIWWALALGAIVSPTDAVATTIVKRIGVSPRVVSILEGESLLNDATALVLLRTMIAGAVASVSLWSAIGDFFFAVIVAVVIGFVVGKLNLWARAKVTDATVNTVMSFTVPFVASIPAEALGASGLVAAVAAGLVTGRGAPRRLSPSHRLSDFQNWRTVEFVLEGAVFLIMGLELFGLVEQVEQDHAGVGSAVVIAGAALVATVIVRAAFVFPLLGLLRVAAGRRTQMKPRLEQFQEALTDPDGPLARQMGLGGQPAERAKRGRVRERVMTTERIRRTTVRLRRMIADVDYLLAAPLTSRDAGVLVWAGMRGAVTLAAAQTLPTETPERELLILIAFVVAAGSLLVQGGTLRRFVLLVKPSTGLPTEERRAEQGRIDELLEEVRAAEEEATTTTTTTALAVITAQRTALLDARDVGVFDSDVLSAALLRLDADQIRLELPD